MRGAAALLTLTGAARGGAGGARAGGRPVARTPRLHGPLCHLSRHRGRRPRPRGQPLRDGAARFHERPLQDPLDRVRPAPDRRRSRAEHRAGAARHRHGAAGSADFRGARRRDRVHQDPVAEVRRLPAADAAGIAARARAVRRHPRPRSQGLRESRVPGVPWTERAWRRTVGPGPQGQAHQPDAAAVQGRIDTPRHRAHGSRRATTARRCRRTTCSWTTPGCGTSRATWRRSADRPELTPDERAGRHVVQMHSPRRP